MNPDFFVDSNIVLYALDNATLKNAIAIDLIKKRPVISTQVVLEESVNICLKILNFQKKPLINMVKIYWILVHLY